MLFQRFRPETVGGTGCVVRSRRLARTGTVAREAGGGVTKNVVRWNGNRARFIAPCFFGLRMLARAMKAAASHHTSDLRAVKLQRITP